jgi:hypothetical protein
VTDSVWTIESLKKYLEEALRAHATLDSERFVAQEKALSLAHAALERRLESMNEFREQIAQRDALYLTKAEYNSRLSQLEATDRGLDGRLTETTSRLDSYIAEQHGVSTAISTEAHRQEDVWARLLGTLAVLASVASIFTIIALHVH